MALVHSWAVRLSQLLRSTLLVLDHSTTTRPFDDHSTQTSNPWEGPDLELDWPVKPRAKPINLFHLHPPHLHQSPFASAGGEHPTVSKEKERKSAACCSTFSQVRHCTHSQTLRHSDTAKLCSHRWPCAPFSSTPQLPRPVDRGLRHCTIDWMLAVEPLRSPVPCLAVPCCSLNRPPPRLLTGQPPGLSHSA